MRTIVLDYFRRWGWAFILSALLQFVIGLGAPQPVMWVSLLLAIQTGAMLLSFDLARGTARVYRTLPVSRHDLARAWRFVAIILPFLAFAACLITSKALKAAIGFGTVPAPSQIAFWLLFAFIWLGLSFHLLTHTSGPEGFQGAPRRARCVGALWGLSFAGGILFLMKMPENWQALQPWHWGLMAVAAVSTFLGWGRAERMADDRARPASIGNPESAAQTESNTAPPAMQSGGLPLLFRGAALNSVRATGMMILFFVGMQILLNKSDPETWGDAARRILREQNTMYLLIPMAMLSGLQWLSCMRHFRTLPLGAAQLTLSIGLILALPLALMLGALVALQTVLGVSFTADQASRSLLLAVPTLITPALLLYLGLSWRSYFLAIAPAFMLIPLADLTARHLSFQVTALMSVAALIFSALLIHRAITRRSQTYRTVTM